MSCLDRIPFSAVVGFILVIAGAGVMAGTLYEALSQARAYFTKAFFEIDESYLVNYVSLALCGTVALLAFFILVFACLVTSATRNKIYRGDRCILGGRCSAALLMFVSYIGQLVWMAVVLILTVPSIAWLMMEKICYEELGDWDRRRAINHNEKFQYTFNLTSYGIYVGPYADADHQIQWHGGIRDDPDQFKRLCNVVRVTGPLFACAFGGAICVFLGLVFLLASLSSYYTKLRLTAELTECRRDLDGLYHPNSGLRLSQSHNYPSDMYPLTSTARAPHYQQMSGWNN